MNSYVFLAGALALTAMSMVSTAQAGTVLGFAPGKHCSDNQEGSGNVIQCTDGGFIHQSYGDTAGVDVQYQDKTFGWERSLSWWGAGYGGANGVLWGGQSDTDSKASIVLKAVAGHSISLEGLGLASFVPDISTLLQVRELDSNLDLMNQRVMVDNTAGTQINFNSLSSSKGWVIEWKNSSWNIGLSQLAFNVTETPINTVPEPASLALLGLGLAAAGVARRKQRKCVS